MGRGPSRPTPLIKGRCHTQCDRGDRDRRPLRNHLVGRGLAPADSRCGTLAAGSLSPATAPTNIRGCAPPWFAGIRSGLSSPAHGLRAMIHAAAVRDARLRCDSGNKQPGFARLGLSASAPVHPHCSARLRAIIHAAAAARYRQTPIYVPSHLPPAPCTVYPEKTTVCLQPLAPTPFLCYSKGKLRPPDK